MIKHVPHKGKKIVSFSDLVVRNYDKKLSSIRPPAGQIEASTSVANILTKDTHKVLKSLFLLI